MSWQILRRQIAIAGQITTEVDELPIAGAQVQITAAPTAFMNKIRLNAKQYGLVWEDMEQRVDRTVTAVDGFYYFLDLPDGDYTITAHLPQRIPSYDFATGTGQVTRDQQGTIQQTHIDMALAPFSGKTYPAAFSPTDIATCQLWLEADTLTLADGDTVTSWADKSAQAVPVVQEETEKAPVFNSAALNGRSALVFNGESSYFTLSLENSATEHTFFAVYDQTPTEGSSNYLFEAQEGRLTLDCAQSSSPFNLRWNDGSWRVIAPAIAGCQLITWQFSGTTGEIWRNGSSLGTATYTPQSLGGAITLGANYQGRSSYFKGNVAAFLYYNRALSLDERQAVETYLNGRYAIFNDL